MTTINCHGKWMIKHRDTYCSLKYGATANRVDDVLVRTQLFLTVSQSKMFPINGLR